MSLKATIQKAVSTAFTILDDLTSTLIIEYDHVETYDVTTSTNTVTCATVTVTGIRTEYKQQELTADILSTDIKFITPALSAPLSLTGFGTLNGVRYKIISPIRLDPSDSLYTIQLRA